MSDPIVLGTKEHAEIKEWAKNEWLAKLPVHRDERLFMALKGYLESKGVSCEWTCKGF
jgi:hypothetical protein